MGSEATAQFEGEGWVDTIWVFKKITLAVVWRIDCRRYKGEKETTLNTFRVVWVRGDGGLNYCSKSRIDKKKVKVTQFKIYFKGRVDRVCKYIEYRVWARKKNQG